MSQTVSISVIIPFYNAQEHIIQCLENVLKQNFKENFEIIMIDDASEDNSLDLIKSFKRSNIFIYSLSRNSGPSAARNLGIKNAKGDYIFFLDVDDTIERNALKTLYDVLNEKNYDLIFSDKKWVENSKNLRKNTFDYPSDQEFKDSDFNEILLNRFNDPISTGKFFGLTGRLIKRSIIVKNKIFFEENLRYLEDDTFMWDILANIKSAKYVHEQLYSYYVYPNVNTALSEGINKGFPINNFKIVREHIKASLKKRQFSEKDIRIVSDQGFIFFIISALISYSRSIIQGKVDFKDGKKIRKKMIREILTDLDVSKAIKSYNRSSKESFWIPLAIKWKSRIILEIACDNRARYILKMRKKNS